MDALASLPLPSWAHRSPPSGAAGMGGGALAAATAAWLSGMLR